MDVQRRFQNLQRQGRHAPAMVRRKTRRVLQPRMQLLWTMERQHQRRHLHRQPDEDQQRRDRKILRRHTEWHGQLSKGQDCLDWNMVKHQTEHGRRFQFCAVRQRSHSICWTAKSQQRMVRLAARLEQTQPLHFEVNIDSREKREFYVRASFFVPSQLAYSRRLEKLGKSGFLD